MREQTIERELAAHLQLENLTQDWDCSQIRLSGLYQCARAQAYRIRNYTSRVREAPQSADSLSIFDTGHALHLWFQQRLSNVGIGWVDGEPTLEDGRYAIGGNFEITVCHAELRVRGTLDALTKPMVRRTHTIEHGYFAGQTYQTFEPTTEDDPDGQRIVLDLKTIGGRDKIWTSWKGELNWDRSAFEQLSKPLPEHVDQASFYAWLTTQPGFATDRIGGPLPKLPLIMIVYLCKDVAGDLYERHPEEYEPGCLLNVPYKAFVQQVKPARIEEL